MRSHADDDGDGAPSCMDVCPSDPTASTSPHTTPFVRYGDRENDALPDTADWSLFPSQAPFVNLDNISGRRVRSARLRLHAFGFSLPSTAQVLGIEARIERGSSSADAIPVRDAEIRLYRSSSAVTTVDLGRSDTWPDPTAEIVSYGGPSELWGRTWSAAEINSVSFGLSIRAEMFGYPDPDVDRVGAVGRVSNAELRVTYCAE